MQITKVTEELQCPGHKILISWCCSNNGNFNSYPNLFWWGAWTPVGPTASEQSWRMHFICSHLWSGVGSVFSFWTKHQTVYVWINVPINYDIFLTVTLVWTSTYQKRESEKNIFSMGIGRWIMWFIPQLPDGYTESTHAGVISNCQLSMLAWNSCSSALYIQNNSNKNNQKNTNKNNNKQCMNVCVYVCMHACMHAFMHAWMNVYLVAHGS